MIDSRWRGYFQPAFEALARPFIFLKIHPNAITIGAFIIGVLSGVCIAYGQAVWAIALLWLSGLLDVLDGSVARITGTTSGVGAYMDLILDRMVEAAVILGFAWLLPVNTFAYLLFFVAVIFNFTTFVVAGALFKNIGSKSMHYDAGLAERTETFIVFSLMALFNPYVFYILMSFNMLIFYTGILRFIKVIKYETREENC